MIKASDQVTKQAYSRMTLGTAHLWARHAPDEAKFVCESCKLKPGDRVLDLGCGNGRHVLELARMGIQVTGSITSPPLSRGPARQLHGTSSPVSDSSKAMPARSICRSNSML
jgi:2-polyprenyl-3-methyl-5-hydroxy-6-metoxy-1,4-benzoquinol methylase